MDFIWKQIQPDGSRTVVADAGAISGTDRLPVLQAGALRSATITQVYAGIPVMVGDSGSGGSAGLVPAPAIGDAGKFLKGNGSWATPPSGGGGDALGWELLDVDLTIPDGRQLLVYDILTIAAGITLTIEGTLAVLS